MDEKQKVALIASSGVSLAGVGIGAAVGTAAGGMAGTSVGAMLGAQVSGQLNGFINTLAPNEQIAQGTTDSVSSTIEKLTSVTCCAHRKGAEYNSNMVTNNLFITQIVYVNNMTLFSVIVVSEGCQRLSDHCT